MSTAKLPEIGFGGGCHWCTEAVFQSLRGVDTVRQGFISSDPPNDAFSEAALVTFDAERIGLEQLIAVHISTHAATSNHSMRGKYRSAIYTFDDAQAASARTILDSLQDDMEQTVVTQVLPYRSFKYSDERFHNYYRQDSQRPFCRTYIDPKLTKIRQRFAEYVKDPGDENTTKNVR